MFSLPVFSLIAYLTSRDGGVWRQVDYDTNKMVKCLKGEEIKGYFDLRVAGKIQTFKEDNREEFLGILCRIVARKLDKLNLPGYSLVPIPNSSATTSSKKDFRTHQIARQIVECAMIKGQAVPALRWKVAAASSRKGGSRDPQVLCDNLELVQRPAGPVILFDDVMTTGAHMKACYRQLMASEIIPTQAIAVGRTTWEQKEKPLNWVKEILQVETGDTAWDVDL